MSVTRQGVLALSRLYSVDESSRIKVSLSPFASFSRQLCLR